MKITEKKPNSNLIDLSIFDLPEDRTNVRVSVLEAFDPLLIKTFKTDQPKEAIATKDANDGN